jgi:hypothetical protein
MILLSEAGWSAPRIAKRMGYCGQTARDLLRAFGARGLDALYPFRSCPTFDIVRGPGVRLCFWFFGLRSS